MRIGAKKRPFYRVVAVDERNKRTGAYLELLGTYNPLTEPHEVLLKQDRIDHWIGQGAQMSDGFLRIIGKAPQIPPRKPKKSHSAPSSAEVATQGEEAPRDEEKKAESVKGEEKPVEEPQPEAGQPMAEKVEEPAEEEKEEVEVPKIEDERPT